MNIQVLNDLHLEFDHLKEFNINLKGGDTLLLVGDICVADLLREKRTDKDAKKHKAICDKFFREECAKFNRVYYIMGNHEHYRGIFDYTKDILCEYLRDSNVTLLEKEWVELNDRWRLFAGTLWTDYNNGDWFAMNYAKNGMNDHHIIKKITGNNILRFHPQDAMDEYKKTIDALETGLVDNVNKNVIVMTHHAPTFQSINPKFKGNPLNYAFANNLEEIILRHDNIKYWFHGHMHDTIDYEVGTCRVLCNPRGYAGHALNERFNLDFTLEI